MLRSVFLVVLVVQILTSVCADEPLDVPRPVGVLVLDNCDDKFRGKKEYKDNLTFVNADGNQRFRISGFNNCESMGSSRMIAVDSIRNAIWVVENVAHRVRRFDFDGKETLIINLVGASAIEVDPKTGNLWALENRGRIGGGKTVVYDGKGKHLATHNITGWDIAFDHKASAFWIADRNLTKVSATTGAVLSKTEFTTGCASSVDVDQGSGAAWVTVREFDGKSNRLLKFDAKGKKLVTIELGQKLPLRVSVDQRDGSAWVAHFVKSVERFSRDGSSQGEFPIDALAVQAGASDGAAWVITRADVQVISTKGTLTKLIGHVGETSQAWVTVID
jgi:hypothetical protein